MIEALNSLFPAAEQAILVGWITFLRVGAMVAVLPAFGEQFTPVRVRLAAAIAFTFVISPSIQVPQEAGASSILMLSVSEGAAGLFFGILLRFFVLVLQIAGTIAAQSTSLSQIFGGSQGIDPQPAIANVLTISGIALMAILGIHVQFAVYILHTYTMVPVGALIQAQDVLQFGLERVSTTFALGFSLAAPFMIASLLYNVILGVINRAMPQLMVSFVGAPAITAGGLLILFASAPVILTVWYLAYVDFVASTGG